MPPITLKGDEARLYVELAERNNVSRVRAHLAAKKRTKDTPQRNSQPRRASHVVAAGTALPGMRLSAVLLACLLGLVIWIAIIALVRRILGG